MAPKEDWHEHIAFLQSDIERLRREAHERDQVINELYRRLDGLEKHVARQAATEDQEGRGLREEFFRDGS